MFTGLPKWSFGKSVLPLSQGEFAEPQWSYGESVIQHILILFEYSASGEIILTGEALREYILSYTGTGEVLLSGEALREYILSYTGSGPIILTGEALRDFILLYISSGKIILKAVPSYKLKIYGDIIIGEQNGISKVLDFTSKRASSILQIDTKINGKVLEFDSHTL